MLFALGQKSCKNSLLSGNNYKAFITAASFPIFILTEFSSEKQKI